MAQPWPFFWIWRFGSPVFWLCLCLWIFSTFKWKSFWVRYITILTSVYCGWLRNPAPLMVESRTKSCFFFHGYKPPINWCRISSPWWLGTLWSAMPAISYGRKSTDFGAELLGVEQSVLHDVIFFSILQVENLPENLQKRLKTISTKWQILGFNRIQLMGMD